MQFGVLFVYFKYNLYTIIPVETHIEPVRFKIIPVFFVYHENLILYYYKKAALRQPLCTFYEVILPIKYLA